MKFEPRDNRTISHVEIIRDEGEFHQPTTPEERALELLADRIEHAKTLAKHTGPYVIFFGTEAGDGKAMYVSTVGALEAETMADVLRWNECVAAAAEAMIQKTLAEMHGPVV